VFDTGRSRQAEAEFERCSGRTEAPSLHALEPFSEYVDLDQYCLPSKCTGMCCADFEDDPMRTLTLTILTMGMVLAGNARAQTYDPAFPVCMYVVYPRGASYQDCSYYTMAQCAASASGRGFQCSFNPYYAGATASPRRHARRRIITPVPAGTIQDTYCLQGRAWGYPGNCLFSSYAQCMAAASGTGAACGVNPQYLFAPQRNGTYWGRY